MPNDGEYGFYMPADNVGHERERLFLAGEESYLSTKLAGSLFSKIHSQIISLINLFMKLFQQPLCPCPRSDLESQMLQIFASEKGTQWWSRLWLDISDSPLEPHALLAWGKSMGLSLCEGRLEWWLFKILGVTASSALDQSPSLMRGCLFI